MLRLPVHGPGDFLDAFRNATRSGAEAVVVVDDVFITKHRFQILDLAAHHSLPIISQFKDFAKAGSLVSYGPNTSAMYRRAAYYVDKILKGTSPRDLPVEQPTKFDLFINLKAARALGIIIPPTLLARADEVIE